MRPLTTSGWQTPGTTGKPRDLWSITTLVGVLIFPTLTWGQSAVPVGTRFNVGLSNKLDATKVHRGKKFSGRTLEPISAEDGRVIPAGAKVERRVSYVTSEEMHLRIEKIDTRWGRMRLVADVVEVVGERNVQERPDNEGDIHVRSGKAKSAAVGALVGAGLGAGAGEGAGIGAGAGAAVGVLHGNRRLVLDEGTRLEVELRSPLVLASNN
jgi:hypothetical protein